MFHILIGFSALSFVFYGISCLISDRMVREFERFGLGSYRQLIGGTQLLAAAGLLLSFAYPICGLIASGGLALQMLMGFGVRLKIKDSVLQASPALFYFALNTYLFLGFWSLASSPSIG